MSIPGNQVQTQLIRVSSMIVAMVSIMLMTPAILPAEVAPWAQEPKAGIEALSPDYLPAEFSPLVLSGTNVTSGNKQVCFNSIGLTDKISVSGRELLGGATLSLVVDGNPLVLVPTNQIFTPAGRGRVLGTTFLSSGSVDVEINVETEFDFIIWHTLTLKPKAGCSLDGLTISYSLDASVGELCAYQDEPPPRSMAGLEAERLRVFRSVRPDENVSRGFCHLFWAGDTRGGLAWEFSSPRYWSFGTNALVLDRPAKQFRLGFVQSARQLIQDQPITFSWSLTPTPIKQMPHNWRTWRFESRTINTSNPPEYPTNINEKIIYWNSLWRLNSGEAYNNNWVRDEQMLREVEARDHAKGLALLPYFVTCFISYAELSVKDGQTYCLQDTALRDLALRYRSEPANYPIQEVPTNTFLFNTLAERNSFWSGAMLTNAINYNARVTVAPEVSDWSAWTFKNMLTNYNLDGGMYVDDSAVAPDFRITTNHPYGGFIDENGTNRPTYADRTRRDLGKRDRNILQQHRPDTTIIAHMNGARPGGQMGLYDILLTGEHFYYWYQEPEKRDASPNGDYYYAHIFGDIDRIRTELFWRQWGIPTLFMPELRGRDTQMFPNPTKGTRTLLSYLLHFDLLIWPTWCDVSEIRRWWEIQDQYGMADDDSTLVDFVPYWENTRITSDADVKVSYYQKIIQHDPELPAPKREDLLVIVSNLKFESRQINLNLPGDLTGCEIVDIDSGETISIDPSGMASFDLDPYGFSVLRITLNARDQAITHFPAIGNQVTANLVTLTATASSGLPVSFAVASGPAQITDGILSFTGTGSGSIVASQAGDTNWNPAIPVTNIFTVSKATATITLGNLSQTYDGNPKPVTVTTVPAGLSVTLTYNGSATAPSAAGSYPVAAAVSNTVMYNGTASGTLRILNIVPVSTNDLTAHWKMDGLTNNVAYDYVGTNHGAAYGSVSASTGWIDGAFSLDGLAGRINIPCAEALKYRGGNMTISGWIKVGADETNPGYIISKPWNGSGSYNYYLRLDAGKTFTFFLNGLNSAYVTSSKALSVEEWHQVGVTLKDDKTMRIYLDGIEVGSAAHSINNWTPVGGDNNLSLVIGTVFPYSEPWAGSSYYSFRGIMDDMRLYTRALSADEMWSVYQESIVAPTIISQPFNKTVNAGETAVFNVTADGTEPMRYQWRKNGVDINGATNTSYTIPVTAVADNGAMFSVVVANQAGSVTSSNAALTVIALGSGLTAHWKLDEMNGTNALDSSGNGNHGTLWNEPAWESGKDCGALKFDGINDYALAPDAVSLDVISGLTMAAWVRTEKTPPAGGPKPFLAKEITYELGFDKTLKTAIRTVNGGWAWIDSGFVVPTNTWNHLAATYNGTSIVFYANGTMVATRPHPKGGSVTNTTYPVYLGARDIDMNGVIDGFLGVELDDVRIYNRALSEAEIMTLTNCVPFTVNDAPTVAITSPANGEIFTASATITIGANASDADGVSKVEFYQGAIKLGEVVASLYTYTWSNMMPGNYALTTRATDTKGAMATSEVVNVTVNKGTATVTLQNLNQTCDGNAKPVTATTVPSGLLVTLTYNGSATAPSAAGSYAVTGVVNSTIYQGTASGILTLTLATVSTNDLTAHWKMDGLAGVSNNIVADSAGTNNGTACGLISPVTGRVDQALSFDGLAGRVNVPCAEALKYRGGNMTFSGWIKISAGEMNTGYIISKPWKSGLYNYYLRLDTNKKLTFVLSGTNSAYFTSSSVLSVEEWHQIGLTLSDDKTMRMYLDGVEVGSKVHTVADWAVADANISLAIGTMYPYGDPWAGNSAYSFAGMMDDLRFYTRVLSAAEMWSIYKSAPAINQPPVIKTQPVSRSVVAGQTAAFSVTATGSTPLTYQWRKNGANISGATGAAYTTPATVAADNGAVFRVVVGNYAGSVTSAMATLTVINQTITFPAIPNQLTSNLVTLTATASSSLPVSFAVVSGPAQITDGILSFTGIGIVSVVATQAGDENWIAAASITNRFTVSKATAAINLVNLSQTYDGNPKPVTVTTVPAGLSVTLNYNGSATAPAAVGSYAVIGVVNTAMYQGTNSGTLRIINVVPVSTNDLTAHWKMDGLSNNVALDSAGDNHGTAYGSVAASSGHINGAFALDGLAGRINVPDAEALKYRGGNMTMSTWIKIGAAETNGGYIIARPWNSGWQYNYLLKLQPNRTLYFYLSGSNGVSITSSKALSVEEWHQVGFTLRDDKTIRIYLDGIEVGSVAHNIDNGVPAGGDDNMGLAIGTVYPYSEPWTGNSAYSFCGLIDDLRLYNRALSADEMWSIYRAAVAPAIITQPADQTVNEGETAVFNVTASGTEPLSYQWRKNGVNISGAIGASYMTPATIAADNGAIFSVVVINAAGSVTSSAATLTVIALNSGLAAHWKLDEMNGTNALDSSGNGNNGTLCNGPTWVSGKDGGALRFDGTNDYALVPDAVSLDVISGLTMAAWVRTGKTPTSGAPRAFLAKEITYELGFDNKLKTAIRTTNGGWAWVDSGVVVPTNVWNHLAATYDGSLVVFYVNGTVVATKPHPQGGMVTNTPYPVCLGARDMDLNGVMDSFAEVELDDVRIYNRAISADEMGSIYQIVATNQGQGFTNKQQPAGNGATVDEPVMQAATIVAGSANSSTEPVAVDFDGDAKTDPTLYRESSGDWFVKLSGSGYDLAKVNGFGGTGWKPVAGDYDGDWKGDPAIYEESSGVWRIMLSGYGYEEIETNLGGLGYKPVQGDFNGGGCADLAVYREGHWLMMFMENITMAYASFGQEGYVPVPGNYTDDGVTDLALYQEASGTWYLLKDDVSYVLCGFGGPGWKPLLGDYDGDGIEDLILYQSGQGNWMARLSGNGYTVITLSGFGGEGDLPVTGDYDGDGTADLALYNAATGVWQVRLSGSDYVIVSMPF